MKGTREQVLDEMLTLCGQPHDFTRGRSCPWKPFWFLNETVRSTNEEKVAEACCVDFSKAPGSVNHQLPMYNI